MSPGVGKPAPGSACWQRLFFGCLRRPSGYRPLEPGILCSPNAQATQIKILERDTREQGSAPRFVTDAYHPTTLSLSPHTLTPRRAAPYDGGRQGAYHAAHPTPGAPRTPGTSGKPARAFIATSTTRVPCTAARRPLRAIPAPPGPARRRRPRAGPPRHPPPHPLPPLFSRPAAHPADMPQPHWISVGQIFPKQQYGVKTTYESLPEDVKKYLNVRKIFPENSQQTNPNLSPMFSPQDVKDLADETLEYLCKEYPLERNTQMRASFEIFCAEIISRSYNEAYKRVKK